MLLYVIVALVCYFSLNFSKKTKNSNKRWFLIITSFLMMFLVSALRVNVGTDYKSYCEWFGDVSSIRLKYENFGFNSLIVFIKLFTNNPQWLFVVTSLLILVFIYIAVFKEQEEYDISVFLFIVLGFYFSTFNGVRQWIAGAIFMYAYQFAVKKNLKLYALLILIASLFHITAVLLLPFYFVFNFKISDKVKMWLVAASLVFFKFFNFNSIISAFLKFVSINFYWRYISSGADLSKGVGSAFPILISGCMLLYYIIFKDVFLKRMPQEKYENRKNLSFILTIFSIINTVNNLFSRFAMYFIPMLVFLLPDTYAICNKKWKKRFKILIIVGGLVFMVINTLLKNSNNPLPYNCIFDM